MSEDGGDRLLAELSRKQIDSIYQNRIVRDFGSEGPPLENPKFIIVGGQQGAGKTTALNAVIASLGNEPTQRITVDNLMPSYPGYTEAAHKDSLKAQRETGNTPGEWGYRLMERAFDNRHNVVLELAPPHNVSQVLTDAKMRGYETEVHVLAVNHEKSWTSVVSRYEHGLAVKADDPRFIERDSHNAVYDKWPGALHQVEDKKLADKISIRDRDERISYENRLVRGESGQQRYDKPERAMENLVMSRNAPLTEKDRADIERAWDINVKSPHLASAMPTKMQDFAEDREAVMAFVKSDASRFDPHDKATHKTSSGVAEWNERVTADAINAYQTTTPRTADLQSRTQNLLNVVQKISERALANVAENSLQQVQAATAERQLANSQMAPAARAEPEQSQTREQQTGSRGRGSR